MLLTLMYMKRILVDPNTIFLDIGFAQKMLESSDSMYSSFTLESIFNITWTHNWSKTHISLRIRST